MDLHRPQARWQALDTFEYRNYLCVLFLGHFARDKDSKMSDVLMNKSYNRLPPGLNLFGRTINISHPVEGLLRRSDVVAHRGKQNDRCLNVSQIEACAGMTIHAGVPQLVAHEEIAHD